MVCGNHHPWTFATQMRWRMFHCYCIFQITPAFFRRSEEHAFQFIPLIFPTNEAIAIFSSSCVRVTSVVNTSRQHRYDQLEIIPNRNYCDYSRPAGGGGHFSTVTVLNYEPRWTAVEALSRAVTSGRVRLYPYTSIVVVVMLVSCDNFVHWIVNEAK